MEHDGIGYSCFVSRASYIGAPRIFNGRGDSQEQIQEYSKRGPSQECWEQKSPSGVQRQVGGLGTEVKLV